MLLLSPLMVGCVIWLMLEDGYAFNYAVPEMRRSIEVFQGVSRSVKGSCLFVVSLPLFVFVLMFGE